MINIGDALSFDCLSHQVEVTNIDHPCDGLQVRSGYRLMGSSTHQCCLLGHGKRQQPCVEALPFGITSLLKLLGKDVLVHAEVSKI